MSEVVKQLIDLAFEVLPGFVSAIGILVATKFGSRLVSSLMNRALRGMQPTLRKFAIRVAETLVLMLGALTALNAVGIAANSVVAVLGAAGLAIGLALQENFSHVASGAMLIVIRPFEVGDFIEVSIIEGPVVIGTVDEIGLFATTMIAPDNVKITLPNALVFNNVLTNNTALQKRRVDINVNIGDRPIDFTMTELIELAQSHPLVLDEPAVTCVVASFSRKGSVLELRPWCNSKSYEGVRSDLQKRIVENLWQSEESQT